MDPALCFYRQQSAVFDRTRPHGLMGYMNRRNVQIAAVALALVAFAAVIAVYVMSAPTPQVSSTSTPTPSAVVTTASPSPDGITNAEPYPASTPDADATSDDDSRPASSATVLSARSERSRFRRSCADRYRNGRKGSSSDSRGHARSRRPQVAQEHAIDRANEYEASRPRQHSFGNSST